MIVLLKDGLIVLTAETDEERASLGELGTVADGHVFALYRQQDETIRLHSLGPREIACREPINVSSLSPDPAIRLISNFAHTPFELHGRQYASVEGFWQGLRWPNEARRREIATLHGGQARQAREGAPDQAVIEYHGQSLRFGTADHFDLMELACRAKFDQNEDARSALINTGERPLTHKMRRDSRSIPGVIMADIWMKIRRELLQQMS
jgi:predicted NAD-dependent protein-ADP-ribosyltransferase YbiA (DUF1768 family)